MTQTESTLTVKSVKHIHGRAFLLISDGETRCMPRAMLKEHPYRSGSPFDSQAFARFLHERAYSFAFDKAISMLAMRARTEKEIRDALQRNAYPEEAIAKVIARLRDAHYLDDVSFAEQWASSRTNRGLGTRRIRAELHRKGVSSDTIDEIVSSIDEDALFDSAWKAALKAAKGKNLSLPAERQKVLAALARRGFDYALSKRALERVLKES